MLIVWRVGRNKRESWSGKGKGEKGLIKKRTGGVPSRKYQRLLIERRCSKEEEEAGIETPLREKEEIA